MDLLIRGGLIVDGSGEKPFYGDIAVERDKIVAIGQNLDASKARKVVDATGLVVTPGLIDGHTHSELSILKNRQHPNAVYQGISTVVGSVQLVLMTRYALPSLPSARSWQNTWAPGRMTSPES